MVDHELLLQKLMHCGIRGVAYLWFKSYLSNRKQFVSLNGASSEVGKLEHGVPQGSILGPLLFLIYINDMPNIIPGAHFILYADDANIIITGKTIKEIDEKLELLLPKLKNWVRFNMLKLNTTKTKYMLISNSINHDFNITINGDSIARVKQEKFLGVLIDEKLTFAAHRQALAKKIASNCGVLFRARHVLSKDSLNKLYYSFIQSHMIYCSNVWGLGSKNSLNKIFISQKRAVRTMTFTKLYKKDNVTGVYTYGHTKQLFKKYEILCIHNVILMQALSLMHKIKLGIAPKLISTLINFNVENNPIIPSLNNKQLRRLNRLGISETNVVTCENTLTKFASEPDTSLTVQKHSFAARGPKLYNHCVSKANYLERESPRIIKHEKLYLDPFKNRLKYMILDIQSSGSEGFWEPENQPLYTFTNRKIVLRNDL